MAVDLLFISFRKVPRKVPKAEVYDDMPGTLPMVMNGNIMFDSYFCIYVFDKISKILTLR